jgi:TolB-like protein/class 3 adenylate cyclase
MEPEIPVCLERRLAAILAADVAGYSRLIEADEEGTLRRLKALRREVVDPKLAEHRGRIVKTTGDGLLVEFASVVDALRSAAEVQAALAEGNEPLPPDRRIEFRIGIHQGDIVVEDGDIFGDGVNVAARLEGLAEPGGICVSARVQEDAAGRLDLAFEDMGDQALKNIARPVRAYRVGPSASGSQLVETAAIPPALPLPDKPSIAVLPFANMSGDPEQDYFADGMVEEITTAISRLPWLFVIARNSSFTYKGKVVDVRQVARELGVRYVLEGSVRKAGNRVRITGQLIDTASSAHIWADHFDGALHDIFELQDQVASSVVGAIEPKLRRSEIERAARKPTERLDAYDLYLRALAQSHKFTAEATREAIQLLRSALDIDPSYAPAAGLSAWCRSVQKSQGWAVPTGPEVAEGLRLARRAIESGPDDPDALWMAGYTMAYLGTEHAAALAAISRALALNPNSAHAWGFKGSVESYLGQAEQAIDSCQRALRLSPLDPLAYQFDIGISLAHLGAHRFEEATEWVDRALRDEPRYIASFRIKVALCGLLGRGDEGRQWLERLMDLQPGLSVASAMTHAATFLSREIAEVIADGLRKAGLPEG